MKIVFISNYFNFHQSGLWDEIVKHEDVDFTFLATDIITEERKAMNYEQIQRDYVKESRNMSKQEIHDLFKDADFASYGDCYDKRVSKYLKRAPHLLVISEHIARHDSEFLNKLVVLKAFLLGRFMNKGDKTLLAMSSHTYDNFRTLLGFENHAYRFGYFPTLPTETVQKDHFSIVWFGRFLKLKGVDYVLHALKYLRDVNPQYHLTLIGEGEDLPRIKELAEQEGLTPCIEYKGFMNHDDVMSTLAKSMIFVFGSNIKEGWGVALNEALANGCICFANSEAGSSKFLIKDRENGYLFEDNASLDNCLFSYVNNNIYEVTKMSDNARKTISEEWNTEIAANRLYELMTNIYNHNDFDKYQSGPISKIK